jgi:hypothetical protein
VRVEPLQVGVGVTPHVEPTRTQRRFDAAPQRMVQPAGEHQWAIGLTA